MIQLKSVRARPAAVGALTLTLAMPFVTPSGRQFLAGRPVIDTRPGQAAFVFSVHGPLNPRRDYSVTIDGSGAVSATGNVAVPFKSLRLSRDALEGLLALAEAERFFTMPATLGGGEPLPDAGSSVITIHTTTETRTVVEQNPTRNARFDQLFAVLNAVVGLP